MKKNVQRYARFVISLMFISHLAAQSQTNRKIEIDTIRIIAHKWKIMELESGGQRVRLPANDTGFYQFKSDGTAIASNNDNMQKEKWKYDHKTKTIVTDENLVIVKISKDSLVLFSNADGMKMNIYLKRID